MTDPLRTDHLADAGEVPERERNARVEGLLLTGLDHYFSGHYELAVSVWTRVLFLDRGHARAKAYIDRARSAIAERQREGDELLHTGAAAFDRGDAGAARRLLNSAVERGAPVDEAQSMIERLNRLEQANPHPARSIASNPSTETTHDAGPSVADKTGSARVIWVATGVMAGLAAAGVVAWIGLTRPDWLPVNAVQVAPRRTELVEPVPVPAPAEAWLSRARVYYEDGRLREALGALEAVGPSDSLRPEADELRASIQRRLLDAARVRPASAPLDPAATPAVSRPRPPSPTPNPQHQ